MPLPKGPTKDGTGFYQNIDVISGLHHLSFDYYIYYKCAMTSGKYLRVYWAGNQIWGMDLSTNPDCSTFVEYSGTVSVDVNLTSSGVSDFRILYNTDLPASGCTTECTIDNVSLKRYY